MCTNELYAASSDDFAYVYIAEYDKNMNKYGAAEQDSRALC